MPLAAALGRVTGSATRGARNESGQSIYAHPGAGGTGHYCWRWTRGYVENVAAAIALAVTDERAAGRIYNVGEPEALAEAEWAPAIGDAAGWDGAIVAMSEEMLPAHLAAPYDWRQHLEAETSRIRVELGYKEKIPREEALRRAVEWERANPPQEVDAKRFDYDAEDLALSRSARMTR